MRRRDRIPHIVCLLLSLCLSCTNKAGRLSVAEGGVFDAHERTDGHPPWNLAADSSAMGRNGLYSWHFAEGGLPRYVVSLFSSGEKNACETLSQPSNREADYWTLQLEFGDAVYGIHRIGTEGNGGVTASLLHRLHGSFATDYKALAGEVNILFAPSYADSRAGTGLRLSGWLSWPEVPKMTILCRGTAFPDGDALELGPAFCHCRDALDAESTCQALPFQECCSHDNGGAQVKFTIPETVAQPCLAMCDYVLGLPDLCTYQVASAQPDGSAEAGPLNGVCPGVCANLGWPSFAVRLITPQITKADVEFTFPDGSTFSGASQPGCPLWPPKVPAELSCDTSINSGPSDTEVLMRVAPPGLEAAEISIKLGPKNHCAQGIAYVSVGVVDTTVEISTPEYRSPCVETGLK